MDFTFTFIHVFLIGVYLISPILMTMGLIIIVTGLVVGRIESWSKFDAIYWSFITALTVGYGDIRPVTRISKALSAIVGMVGIMFTGVLVSITLYAAMSAFEKHTDPAEIEAIKNSFEVIQEEESSP